MAATYEPIASTTLGSASASVTLSGIAGDWTDLRIIITGASNRSGASYDGVRITFNSDTGTNYSFTRLTGDGSAASSTRGSNFAYGVLGSIVATGTGTPPSNLSADVMSYASTSVYKTILSTATNPGYRVGKFVSLWRSTSAITSATFTLDQGSFIAGTVFSLYGIKAA